MSSDAAGLLPASVWDVFQPCQQSSSGASQKGGHGSLLMFAALLGWFRRLGLQDAAAGGPGVLFLHPWLARASSCNSTQASGKRVESTISRWIEGQGPIGLGATEPKVVRALSTTALRSILFPKKTLIPFPCHRKTTICSRCCRLCFHTLPA